MNTTNQQRFITLSQCAHVLRMSKRGLADAAKNGMIPAIDTPEGFRFRLDIIEQMMLDNFNFMSQKRAMYDDVMAYSGRVRNA